MSISKAMNSAVSGVGAEGEALGVVGDNISNSETTGFKEQRAGFENVLGRSMLAEGGAGAGVKMGAVTQAFTQGPIVHTGVPTDLALTGDGFFMTTGTLDGVTGQFFTRSGAFRVDATGTLVTPDGLAVQGYPMLPTGVFSPSPSNLQIPTSAIPANPTKDISLVANLDSNSVPPAAPWDPQSPGTTANFVASVGVFDSLGNSHNVQIAFRNTAPGQFTWFALAPGADLTAGTPGQNSVIGQGTVSFGTDGTLTNAAVTIPISAGFVGATPQNMTLSLGTGTAAGGTGLDGVTQFAAPSATSAISQDGYSSGGASGFIVDGSGVVRGLFTNGQNRPIGQLTVAKFRSNVGLVRAGHNAWIASQESGVPALGAPGSGGRGAVSQGALEQSNVDVATQFVNLIAHQRGFQANTKVITTADDMLAELVTLKR